VASAMKEREPQRELSYYKERLESLSSIPADSPATFEMVRGWLEDCVANHSLCSCPTVESLYPNRLLEVRGEDGDQTIRLVTTESLPAKNSRYLALSHCWGSSSEEERKLKITTKANLTERTANIALQSLPRLYQDAVQVTRKLGERYLWVDSLCIIQDSDEDWFHESMLMGKIYEHAYCTISADSAPGSNSPIFKERSIAVSKSTLEDWKDSWFKTPEYLDWSYLIRAEPLSTRAWALQERQLSRRIVHYTSYQVLWECVTMNASELFPEGIPDTSATNRIFNMGPIGPTRHIMLSKGIKEKAQDPSSLMYLWYWFVGEFSTRNLTIPEDKLPALSGIANSLISMTGKDYIAGLWRHDLCHGLAWTASRKTDYTHTRLKSSAPSWSWASITGSINFWTFLNADDFVLDVLDISVTPISKHNPMGRLTNGILKARGHLRSGRWDNTSKSPDYATRTSGDVWRTIILEDGTRLERTHMYFDVEDDSDCTNGSGSLYFLCLYGSTSVILLMILLRVCEKTSRYRRIGLLGGLGPDFNVDLSLVVGIQKTYLEIE
jgi:hypothetical protein